MKNEQGLKDAIDVGAAVAVRQESGGGQLSIARLEQLAGEIDKRLELFDRIHQIIDTRVSPACFDRLEDTVCRNANYAKVVHGIVRGNFYFLKNTQGEVQMKRLDYTDSEGAYYVYEVFGAYELGGTVTEAHGSFSSRDKFLGKAGGGFKEVWDVNERSVREAAITECFKKAVFKSLGYGDADAAEMTRAGKDATTFGGHQFQAGSKGGSTDNKEQADKRGTIEKMCRELLAAGFKIENEAPPQKPEDVLLMISCSRGSDKRPDGKFGGWRSFRGITDKGLDRTFGDVKRAHDKFAKAPDEPKEDAKGADDDLPFIDPKK